MAALTNLSFETAGASPGLALGWTLTPTSSLVEIGVFGDDAEPVDGFEGWLTGYVTAFEDADLAAGYWSAAFFASPARLESFEAGWSNTTYHRALPAVAGAVYAGRTFENFEAASWSNPGQTSFEPSDLEAAALGTGFEAGWGNDSYLLAFTGGELVEAAYARQFADSRETFEHVRAAQEFHASVDSNGILTDDPHEVELGWVIEFKAGDGDTLPEPLRKHVRYFVLEIIDGWTFTVSRTDGGAELDITTLGDGIFTFTAPAEHWATALTTV